MAEKSLSELQKTTLDVRNGKDRDDALIREFIAIAKEHDFERSWIEAFFDAMRADLSVMRYETYAQLQEYMYGSAEVIGLMMTQLI